MIVRDFLNKALFFADKIDIQVIANRMKFVQALEEHIEETGELTVADAIEIGEQYDIDEEEVRLILEKLASGEDPILPEFDEDEEEDEDEDEEGWDL